MNPSEQDHTLILRTPSLRIFGHRSHELEQWRVEVTLKDSTGVYYSLDHLRTEQLSVDALRQEAFRSGIYSPRPFALGMKTDLSTSRCLYALAHALCVARGFEPYVAWLAAHECRPPFEQSDLVFIAQQAEWEGTVYPLAWDAPSINQLVVGLRRDEEEALADFIERRFGATQAQD